jgi:ABC-type multidrug transport system fused ATPase/permease subunit
MNLANGEHYLKWLRYKFHQINLLVNFAGKRASSWMVLGIIGSLVLSAVELGIAYFIPVFFKTVGLIDSSFTEKTPFAIATSSTWVICGGLIMLGLLRFLGQYLVNQAGIAGQEEINSRLRKILIYRVLLHPNQSFMPASQSNYYFGTVFFGASSAVYLMTQAAAQVLQSIGLVFVMISLTWKETFVGLVGLFVIGLSVRAINKSIRAKSAIVPQENKKLITGFERVSRNWLLVRILRTQGYEYGKFSQSISTVHKHTVQASSSGNIAVAGTPLLGIFLLTAIVLLGQTYWATPGSVLISFLYVFIRFVQGLSAMVGSITSTSRYIAPFNEAVEFFCSFSKSEVSSALSGSTDFVAQSPNLQGQLNNDTIQPPSISVQNLTFSYGSVPVLNDISFSIPGGKTIGIIGPSGSGKSTLMLLMLGALDPDSGRVVVGHSLAKDILRNQSTKIGYVGPEPFLFEGSIRENLTYGIENVSEEDIWEALKQARLYETVATISGNLEHKIAENGDGLSAGQKQRLCLARIFLSKPSLVILDEATANLDLKTELEVVSSLDKIKSTTTIVIVTHRMTALKHADYVFDMENSVFKSLDSQSLDEELDVLRGRVKNDRVTAAGELASSQ